MGDISEFSFGLRAYLKAFRWERIDPVPWTPLAKPLSQANLALVSTAGFVLPGQAPFDSGIRAGDASLREIAGDAEVSTMVEYHRSDSFDHSGVRSDPNLGFPLDCLRELQRDGVVGRLNRRHLSYMGSITAPKQLIEETAPAGARLLAEDGVDAVLLVPV
jgi:D-proline reductase (dithiol) PrdB